MNREELIAHRTRLTIGWTVSFTLCLVFWTAVVIGLPIFVDWMVDGVILK